MLEAPDKERHVPADGAAPRLQTASCQQAGEGQAEKTGLLPCSTGNSR